MRSKSINFSENLQELFDFYQITAMATPVEENIVSIDGVIGWDVEAKDVSEKLKSFNNAPVTIEISSPGGFVFEGLHIFNLIKNYKGETTTRLMGISASMASYIALAADNVTAEDNAIFMIHNARGVAFGDQNDMRKTADLIDRISGMLAQAYVAKTGKSEKEVREMMDTETFLFGNEMKKAGFVDEIIKTEKKSDKKAALDLAQAMIKDCTAKMKESENGKKDIEQLAAMIGKIEPAPAPATEPQTGLLNISNNQNPATKAEIKTEVNNMTLQELLAQNPAAKIEFDNEIKNATSSGFEACEKETKARIAGASPYLGKDSTYPQTIKAQAALVVTGELPLSALQAAASAHDATIEALKSSGAIKESEALGDTPAQQSGSAEPENGITETNAQFDAMMAKRHPKKQAVA